MRAVAAATAQVTAGRPQAAEELKAVRADIQRTEQALERYFSAFEEGRMDDSDCAPRIRPLNERLLQLRIRESELGEAESTESPTIDPLALAAIRDSLETLVLAGESAQVKGLLHSVIAEVVVDGPDHISPVFRLLTRPPVRKVGKMVGGEGLEPSTSALSALRSAC